jgi:hypothetical protein
MTPPACDAFIVSRLYLACKAVHRMQAIAHAGPNAGPNAHICDPVYMYIYIYVYMPTCRQDLMTFAVICFGEQPANDDTL